MIQHDGNNSFYEDIGQQIIGSSSTLSLHYENVSCCDPRGVSCYLVVLTREGVISDLC
jgi:hypothetical protein